MAVDTPARIAILGAGPIGLEAALYARYLGYDVDIYERGRVAENIRAWGFARMFTPFGASASPLGIAALSAQEANWRPPAADALLTGQEFIDRYLAPLAASDLLVDSLRLHTEVVSVGRASLLKGEGSEDERIDADFRLLLRRVDQRDETGGAAPGAELEATADIVIDTTGIYGQHNWLGAGGIPALGERAAEAHIEYGLADILGGARDQFAHRHTLVVGCGPAAARSVIALTQLAHEAPYTRITWLPRRAIAPGAGPVEPFENDPWPLRDERLHKANELVRTEAGHLQFLPDTNVERVLWHGGGQQFEVRLSGAHSAELAVDRIIANVGYRPDNAIFRELRVAVEPVLEAPTRWPAARHSQGQEAPLPDVDTLITAEPDFYVLGAKSLGRDSRFTISSGLDQIRQLFTLIGDRADLNLYRSGHHG